MIICGPCSEPPTSVWLWRAAFQLNAVCLLPQAAEGVLFRWRAARIVCAYAWETLINKCLSAKPKTSQSCFADAFPPPGGVNIAYYHWGEKLCHSVNYTKRMEVESLENLSLGFKTIPLLVSWISQSEAVSAGQWTLWRTRVLHHLVKTMDGRNKQIYPLTSFWLRNLVGVWET